MSRQQAYNVPTIVIADQGTKIHELYQEDAPAHKSALKGIGLGSAVFDRIGQLGVQLADLENIQEVHKADARVEQAEATAATAACIAWRNEEVLPRAKLAYEDDPKLTYFRPGRLRSQRAAVVDREVRILIDAIERFAHLPQSISVGLDAALATRGRTMLATLRKEDLDAVQADAVRSESTALLREVEDELSGLLASVEKRAAIVFKRGSAELRHYRMNAIRNYVATQHKGGEQAVDPTAFVNVEDPDPSAGEG